MADFEKVAKIPALAPNALQQAEFARLTYAVSLPEGTQLKTILAPNYWMHVAAKLKPKTRIEVTTDDNAFFAELYVVACDRTWAKVVVLRMVDFRGEKKAQEPEKEVNGITIDEFNTELHYVDYVNGQSKGRVILREGKVVVKEGFGSKKEAADWMRQHEAALAKQSDSLVG